MPPEPVADAGEATELFLAAVVAEFRPLDETVRPSVVEDLLIYLRTGRAARVVEELAAHPDVQERVWDLGRRVFSNGHSAFTAVSAPVDVYEHFDDASTEVGLRWAQFLAVLAERRGAGWGRLSGLDDVTWVHALVDHIEHLVARALPIAVPPGVTPPGCVLVDAVPIATRPSHQTWEALLVASGEAPDTLLRSAFRDPCSGIGPAMRSPALVLAVSPGYSDALRRHVGAVRAAIDLASTPSQREGVLRLIRPADDDAVTLFVTEWAGWATAGREQVRREAADLLDRCGPAADVELLMLASDRRPARRREALALLHERVSGAGDYLAVDRVRDLVASDRAESVRTLLGQGEATAAGPAADGAAPEAPQPEAPIVWATTITAEQDRWLAELLDGLNAAADQARARNAARASAPSSGYGGMAHLAALTDEHRRILRDYLSAPSPDPVPAIAGPGLDHALRAFLRARPAPPLSMAAMVKLFAALGVDLLEDDPSGVSRSRGPVLSYVVVEVAEALHTTTGRPTLLELMQLVSAFGVDPRCLLTSYADPFRRFARRWPAADLEPGMAYLAGLGLLTEQLALPDADYAWAFQRPSVFTAAGMVKDKPAGLLDLLYAKAFGSAKGDRSLAQEALQDDPGKAPRIVAALTDGRAEVRTAAAHWLGRLRLEPALSDLEKAAVRERHDVTKAAMLDALEMLGRPVGQYLRRERLGEQAAKGLAKGIPAVLGWYPWKVLPTVHWADTGDPVPDDVVRWWLVQAVKLKSPEPGALMRRYCLLLDEGDRHELGRAVLRAWLAEDLRPPSDEQLWPRALKWAQEIKSYDPRNPDARLGLDDLARKILPEVRKYPWGGAGVASKGLLSVVAACGEGDVVRSAADYITTYYGTRAAQGKALIAMLGWVDHPAAVQVLLGLRRRFRTPGFREEAARQVDALAERRGWTVDELGDRTVPSAGFDDTGRLELSYGGRSFTAVLGADLSIELRGPGGVTASALPAARSGDEEKQVVEAKRQLAAARKDLKALVKQQTDRLHEAMCLQREWSFADWDTYLNHHPVLRRLAQRLVWVHLTDDGVAGSFRPLDDATLTDHQDAEVRLGAEAVVRIAHELTLDADDIAAWQAHLADYEVATPFVQFGRGTFVLPQDRAEQTALDDVDGVELGAFALRTRATRHGYTRGTPVDGPWFVDYSRQFPGRGIAAVLEFSGNELPQTDKQVGLRTLTFTGPQGLLRLGEVPPVLLSECFRDLMDIAGKD